MTEPTRNNRINQVLQKTKRVLLTRDAFIFLFFLALSSAFWFVHSLDQFRETNLKIPIDYLGIPDDIAIEEDLPLRMEIDIRDKGLTLLKYRKRNMIPIALDIDRKFLSKGKVVVTQDQLRNRLSQYVFSSTTVLAVKPDSIVFNYSKLVTKKLPVKLRGEVKLASQYTLSDSILLTPSEVMVYGPKHQLDTMTRVLTEKFDNRAISDSAVVNIKLEKAPKGVKYEFYDVEVSIFAEMFTENKIEVPITIINKPTNIHVRLFPQNVSVTYHVGLSNYNRVHSEDIQLVFDYNEAKELNKKRYTLQLLNHSPYISNVRLSPERVEFLIEEQ